MVTFYSLIIYAKDNQGTTASQTILIQIADVNEPPTFTGSLAQGDQGTKDLLLEGEAPVDIDVGTVPCVVLCALMASWQ
jgi:hypothetical protein